jgi:hemerythrin-like metal-binding protein
MTLLAWSERFKLGIPSVDHEHKELIDLINELHDRLGHEPTKDDILAFLEEINAKIHAHFALEEKVMRGLGYDELDPHKNEHEKLLDGIHDIMDRAETAPFAELERDLAAELKGWFGTHFATKDARLHRFLEEQGIDEETFARQHPDA